MPLFHRPVEPQVGQSVAGAHGGPGLALGERCRRCDAPLLIARFDTTFRFADGGERQVFNIPGGLCRDCHELHFDHGLMQLLGMVSGRCVFAIENDARLRAAARAS